MAAITDSELADYIHRFSPLDKVVKKKPVSTNESYKSTIF